MLQFTEGVQRFYSRENYYYLKDPEGFQHFLGGGEGELFPGRGSKC